MYIYDPIASALGISPNPDLNKIDQSCVEHISSPVPWNKGLTGYKMITPATKERGERISRAKKGKIPFFKDGHPGARAVICNETKKVYPTGKAAALDNNGSPQNMHHHLYGRQKTFRGLTFSFYNK